MCRFLPGKGQGEGSKTKEGDDVYLGMFLDKHFRVAPSAYT